MTIDKSQVHLPASVTAPSRFRNPIGRYRIRRNSRCISCGLCAELCPHGVHLRHDNYSKPLRPRDDRCIGFACRENDFFCVDRCPQQDLQGGGRSSPETHHRNLAGRYHAEEVPY